QWFPAFFGVVAVVRGSVADSDFQAAEVPVKAQTTVQIPPRAVYTGSGRVPVSPISRQESHGFQTAISVGTSRSQGRAHCSDSTLYCGTPSVCEAPGRHAL